MTCPGCAAEMTAITLDGHGGTSIVIDACTACQAFWFDKRESLQLAPASTLKLFSLVGEQFNDYISDGPLSTLFDAPARHP